MSRSGTTSRKQHGVAALIVVLVLFFIVSLVAAYTSRNLVFEQRTSANQYRSTLSTEAAEAGIEWALAMLNEGRIGTDCTTASAGAADTTFRDRYLTTNDTAVGEGAISVKKGATSLSFIFPTCVMDNGAWTCTCPVDGTASPGVPTSAGVHPAFRVAFRTISATGKVSFGGIQIFANGCTRLDDNCLKLEPGNAVTAVNMAVGADNESTSSISVVAALTFQPASPPPATLTALGNVDLGGAAMQLYNPDVATGGLTLRAGGSISNSANLVLGSTPGTPATLASTTIASDSALLALSADATTAASRMFASVFNMWPATFANQPAVVVSCSSGTCSAATVRATVSMNPGRPVLIKGNLALDSAGNIGSATAPVLLVVDGNLDFSSHAAVVYGLVYGTAATWQLTGTTATIRGAVVAQGNVNSTATATLVHDRAVLNILRFTTGSFVRLPGGWKDYLQQ